MSDNNGHPPGFLSVIGLEVVDEKGRPRIELGVRDHKGKIPGPVFRFLDPKGNIRLTIGLDDNDQTTRIVIGDQNGKQRLSLGVDNKTASIYIGDQKGELRVALGCADDQDIPSIHFYDEAGNLMLAAGIGPDGKPAIAHREDPEKELKSLVGESDG